MTKPAQFVSWPEALNPGFGPYRMVAERVVDGDTIYGFVDLGLNEYAYGSFRLSGVDAPEIFSGPENVRTWGREAADKLREMLPVGTKLMAETFKDRQTFGRYIVLLRDGAETSVNERMDLWLRAQEWWPEYEAWRAG